MKVSLNGRLISVADTFPNITLLDFIRDYVGLKGTKFGCGGGHCGACTVHVDGEAHRSCQLKFHDVAGQDVITIEGLSSGNSFAELHPVQRAWIEEDVPQCGYCQAGQIMTAAALLRRNASPSEEEIRDEMNGNLCRCGTYIRIRKAIVRASKEV